MIYADFELFALSNAIVLLFLLVIFPVLIYFSTRKKTLGFLSDPFHFYYTFTYGTSYAVLTLMLFLGQMDFFSVYITFGFGTLFFLVYKASSNVSLCNFSSLLVLTKKSARSAHILFFFSIVLYFLLAIFFLMSSGFGAFAESRFESAAGNGVVVRLLEPVRLLIVGYYSLYLLKQWKVGKPNVLKTLFVVFFLLFSALINGAKFALLEAIYVVLLVKRINNIVFEMQVVHAVLLKALIFFLMMFFVLFIMANNIFNTGGDPFADSLVMPGFPVLLERLVGRILWNADMYFLALPNQIYESINIDNTFTRFFTAILGSKITSQIVGYDASQYDIGRQIWLYWAPDDVVMRGPTNHFDLAAYYYFGSVFGGGAIVFLAFVIAQFHRLLRKIDCYMADIDPLTSVFLATFWCKLLTMLMNPFAGLAWCMDLFFVLLVFAAVASYLSYLNKQ